MARRQKLKPLSKDKLKEKEKRISDGIAASQTVLQNLKEDEKVIDKNIKDKKKENAELDKIHAENRKEIKKIEGERKEAVKTYTIEMKKVKEMSATKEEKERLIGELDITFVNKSNELNSKISSTRDKYEKEEKSLKDKTVVLRQEEENVTSSIKAKKKKVVSIAQNLEKNTQTAKELDVVINSKKVEIIKKDELLTNQSTASENARELIAQLNKEKSEKDEEIKEQKEISRQLVKDNEGQLEELEKNRKLNLALIKKSKRIPALLATIQEVYEEAGIKLNLT